MSKINDGGLLEALRGERGDLDDWLESRNESEVRAAILALVSPQETLRDKFAAKAMPIAVHFVERPGNVEGPSRFTMELSSMSFSIADAMLKAREAKP